MARLKATADGTIPFTPEEEMEADAIMAIRSAELYKNLRAGEYPSITDYIDGIVKGDQAQVQAYIDACLAVKAKYPKPDAT